MDRSERVPNSLSLAFLEDLYADWLRDPASVPGDWRQYFQSELNGGARSFQAGPSFRVPGVFEFGAAPARAPARDDGRAAPARAVAATPAQRAPLVAGVSDAAVRQDRVDQLIRAYRVRGHMVARIDPLGLPRPAQPELDPGFYELSPQDLDRYFSTRTIHGAEVLTLAQMLERLQNTYCRSIGVQFMHIDDLDVKSWLQDRMEGTENRIQLGRDEQLRILTKLTDAVMFEEFIQKKYLGAKSFSLEGSESLIPLLAFAIERASELGIDEVVLGMAHRGRLNVLSNIMGKSAAEIFREFEDKDPELYFGSGDVKYHLGYSSDYVTAAGKKMHMSLCFNPSHLEFVNTVVLGRTRAKQDRAGDHARRRKLALLIHGDAAFAGEGIVQETLNLSGLEGYAVGGTVHVITNNQIGFTTPPTQGRSSTYATDVAKMLQIPIFHVNGEDPEAVAQVVRLALDFRDRFCRDVVIDMYGYRRHGHNEGDEPSFTQPLMYEAVAARSSVRDGYLEHLSKLGEVTRDEADQIAIERREELERELGEARREDFVKRQDWLGGYWRGYEGGPEAQAKDVDTSHDRAGLARLLELQTKLPAGFHAHKKIARLLAQRAEMAAGERPLDWGTAELLALATLLEGGMRVRMTGQDCERGTFSQRHSVLHDVEDGHQYMPLAHLSPRQGPLEIHNSPLSEAGVLGFEYGYSLDWPDALVLWEAQFGDFANAAQVIIDQFLSSAEDKWKRLSGLVMLLPHGFEGMGPEHSSARLERFLMLSAEDNMQIAQPSTPAQHFHLLRRQALRPWRKPLIVFTPKSLLRHPHATSSLDDCAAGGFERILPDAHATTLEARGKIQQILLSSGKVYYDLDKHREDLGRKDVAILRLEQLYPLAEQHLARALEGYRDGTPVVWAQDEPENMGAWRYLRARFGDGLLGRFPFSGAYRPESASPATGSASSHKLEQQALLERAFERPAKG
ncbi:MAG: 2-oxoglutarate dehydrogenase E1 component [Sorangiineae bacterium]|nr:2-oxoglutarate dehydrogenase E1 component [Polyangiaceae bacterium]MEB2322455.1 2-oxoglutarate dehydrogenase E1 component [Sorangiineae bacterium]